MVEAEALSAIASLAGRPYPRAALTTAWQAVLLNQFHDILPGSSVREVYEDTERQYGEILSQGQTLRDGALQAFASAMGTQGGAVAAGSMGTR